MATIAGAVVLFNDVKNSSALDPGCRYTESAIAEFLPEIVTDRVTIANDSDTGNQVALQADAAKAVGHVESMQSAFNKAIAVTTHQSLRDAADAVNGDLSNVTIDLQEIELGSAQAFSSLLAYGDLENLVTDVGTVDNVCKTL